MSSQRAFTFTSSVGVLAEATSAAVASPDAPGKAAGGSAGGSAGGGEASVLPAAAGGGAAAGGAAGCCPKARLPVPKPSTVSVSAVAVHTHRPIASLLMLTSRNADLGRYPGYRGKTISCAFCDNQVVPSVPRWPCCAEGQGSCSGDIFSFEPGDRVAGCFFASSFVSSFSLLYVSACSYNTSTKSAASKARRS